ncbi:isocitrate/isopropylmalate family dehydrogenase [Pantoea endophytica]|uniref:isocitrate/isopropylmalate family dehydrogenase n=1 Tax=Pantoea endophytica TaxID=92488 RepID=UPI002475591E|nr:isocitrate/isopropylmalate family dehydrogenase [Pantoea endophytica]
MFDFAHKASNMITNNQNQRIYYSAFGSAPDIAGKGVNNPIGQIWSGAMMLEHLDYAEAGAAVLDAIELTLAAGNSLTRELDGRASTGELGAAIAAAL